MWARLGRWFVERWRTNWRRDGPYGTFLPPVVVFLALNALEGEDGDTSAVAVIVSVVLALAVWLLVRWVRNGPLASHQDDRSS